MPEKMFIEQRLEALNKIDEGIVQLLESLGCIFETYTVPSKSDFQDVSQIRDHFSGDVRKFYSSLSNVAISLRKEVKLLDDNTGTSQLNKDLVMVLPVSVEKKNTALGEIKLEAELKNLE